MMNSFTRRIFAGTTLQSLLGVTLLESFDQETSLAQAATTQQNVIEVSNITALKALINVNNLQAVIVLGYHTPGDGGGGIFYADKADLTSLDNGGTNIVGDGSVAIRWKRVYESNWISIKWFGAKGDGMQDDTTKIQSALDIYNLKDSNLSITGTVYCPPGRYKITRAIKIDSYKTSLYADAIWDASTITSGAALIVIASVGNEGGNSFGRKGKIEGLRLLGSSRPGTIGIDFNSPNLASSTAILVERCSVQKFETGIRHANRSYMCTILHSEVFNCDTCISCPPGFAEYGERITYISCIIYNSNLALYVNSLDNKNISGAVFQFTDCSFDYTGRLFDLRAGQIYCHGCHFESNRWSESIAPIQVAAYGYNLIKILGGDLMVTSQLNKAPNYIVLVNGSTPDANGVQTDYGEVHFDNVALGLAFTKSDYFWKGSGRCYVRNRWIGSTFGCPFMSEDSSFMADGSFKHSTIVDPIWITNDTAEITNRLHGVNINLSIVVGGHTGSQSLQLSKTFGKGSAAGFVLIFMPVDQYRKIGWKFYQKAGAGGSGITYWSSYWAKSFGLNSKEIPKIEFQKLLNGDSITVEDKWSETKSGSTAYFATPPEWATHFLLEINAVNAIGKILFDDVQAWYM